MTIVQLPEVLRQLGCQLAQKTFQNLSNYSCAHTEFTFLILDQNLSTIFVI